MGANDLQMMFVDQHQTKEKERKKIHFKACMSTCRQAQQRSANEKRRRPEPLTGDLNAIKQCESLCVSTASQASQKSTPQYAQRNHTPWILDMQRSHTAAVCDSPERYVCGSTPGGGPAGDLYLQAHNDG